MTEKLDLFNLQCTKGVSELCEDITVPMNAAGFELVTSEIVTNANFVINYILTNSAGDLTWEQKKALNSFRCAMQNGGENAWNFMAAGYYFLQEFADESQKKEIQT
jgi:hypothetical protein